RRDLAVVDAHRARDRAQGGDALLHDLGTLVHLLDAHEVTREAITRLAHRDVEIHAIVDVVGLRLAQVPGDPRGADHRTGESPVERLLRVDDTDIDRPHAEDAFVVQELLDVLQEGPELLDPGIHRIEHAVRHVLVHTAGPEVGRVHARAAHALV